MQSNAILMVYDNKHWCFYTPFLLPALRCKSERGAEKRRYTRGLSSSIQKVTASEAFGRRIEGRDDFAHPEIAYGEYPLEETRGKC